MRALLIPRLRRSPDPKLLRSSGEGLRGLQTGVLSIKILIDIPLSANIIMRGKFLKRFGETLFKKFLQGLNLPRDPNHLLTFIKEERI